MPTRVPSLNDAIAALDAAGEGAGAPAVPTRVLALNDAIAALDAAGEGAGAPAVPTRGFAFERRDRLHHESGGRIVNPYPPRTVWISGSRPRSIFRRR